jgi:penicillin-binding protein 1B
MAKRRGGKGGLLRRLVPGGGRNVSRKPRDRGPLGRVARWLAARLGGFAFWSALLFLVVGGGYALYISPEVKTKFEGRHWRIPSKVYSDSLTLLPGQSLEASDLLNRLRRLNYQATDARIVRQGEYRIDGKTLDIHLRDFDYPHERVPGYWLRVVVEGGRIASLTHMTERRPIYSAEIEPELIARFFGAEREEREVVPVDEIPADLVHAVLAIEDRYFYVHPGVNPVSTVRAALTNLVRPGRGPGGSTITQQLVKNFYLSPERTVTRKAKEMVRAVVLEMMVTKPRILEAYLNEIYFGQSGNVSICGVGEAARFFFQKNVRSLDLAESATLAALIRSPALYNPRRAVDRATARRNLILGRMLTLHLIDKDQYARAARLEIKITQHTPSRTIAPYFIDFLRAQLETAYSDEILISEGLRIFTTLDVGLQQIAERALQGGIADLEKRYPRLAADSSGPLEAALVVLQPQTGNIRAMVGGRSYAQTQYNRVADAKRQPGSVFKPFTYLAGFVRAGQEAFPFTAADRVKDEPVSWALDRRRKWTPRNYGGEEYGEVTVRMGLEKSINRVTVALAERIGLARVLDAARAAGIREALPEYPSVVLGAAEVRPIEIAAAYSTLAAQGSYAEPFSVKEVVDSAGKVLQKKTVRVHQVLSPQAAYLTTYLMQGVLDRGTAAAARALGFTLTAAGKTGTTDDNKDAWFVGYTPSLLAAVWVGFDRTKQTGLTGATGALPIWTEFMAKALAGQPDEPFPVPPDIVFAKIDRATGKLAAYGCEDVIDEAFVDGTQPTQECDLHKDPIIERFRDKLGPGNGKP